MPVLEKTWSDTIMNRTVHNWTNQLVRYHHKNTNVKMIWVFPIHVCAVLNESFSTCLCLGRHDQIKSWTELYKTEPNSQLGITMKTLMLRWSLHFNVHVCADLNESNSTCLCLGRHDQIKSWTELYKTEQHQLVRYHHENTNVTMICAFTCTCLCLS